MIKTIVYEVIPYLPEGTMLPDLEINNGTEWVRKAINLVYNRNKPGIKEYEALSDLFHNHNQGSGQTIARYPLVQYQKHPSGYYAVGHNEGCRALSELFSGIESVIPVNQQMQISVRPVFDKEQQTHPVPDEQHYMLTNWLPFNRENHRRYKQTRRIADKIILLEQLLQNHLLKDLSRHLSLGWDETTTQIYITDIDSFSSTCIQMRVNKHIHDFQPFNVVFSASLNLPEYICLGNGKVYGFGLITPIGK